MPALTHRDTPAALSAPRRMVVSAIPIPVLRHALFFAMMGRRGHFRNPRTFNEKVNWRIFNDRRDRIAAACDKTRMKQMARAAYPDGDLRIPDTYWSGTDLRDAPDLDALPPWVLKPNASSGRALFGPDPRHDLAELRAQTRSWYDETPAEMGEWGYGVSGSGLLLEERIPTPDGSPPVDYKFFVFAGRVEMIQVNRDRFGRNPTVTFLDADWRRHPVRWTKLAVADEPRPAELDKMLHIARVLGADWDFIRIDLYAVDGEVWFGEYTPYPGGGLYRFKPEAFDRELGRHWTLPTVADVRPGRP
ncbi:ATP-grasp fold amidoligase family protein [Mycolicibacterium bacteremicum]|uniref:Teichuronopeptide biosynthesis TupA-like protein n=1 Tax=Mycolicibacterium bacteremicum TaxID=564198 RepID=A0A1W9Z3Y7_MYCBA|nr:ATP-grasp fold amidoligase family protein [Mycolicibacterium bacteremicum]MCV7433920.1 hypothetical protein [Mycolicibacterium bacteremicum]ORA07068.1 hypothetical protein BST17_00910 [Mycolicibacterium bacteremicum]